MQNRMHIFYILNFLYNKWRTYATSIFGEWKMTHICHNYVFFRWEMTHICHIFLVSYIKMTRICHNYSCMIEENDAYMPQLRNWAVKTCVFIVWKKLYEQILFLYEHSYFFLICHFIDLYGRRTFLSVSKQANFASQAPNFASQGANRGFFWCFMVVLGAMFFCKAWAFQWLRTNLKERRERGNHPRPAGWKWYPCPQLWQNY